MTRLATIGAGNIVEKHLANFDELDGHEDVEIVAICDVNDDAAKDVAADYDAAVYTDHERLFVDASFDALIIGLPPFAHTNQELLAAENDVDVLVEKPLGLSREKIREIDRIIDAASIVSQVGHMYRHAKITERAEELIGDRILALADGEFYSGVPPVDWWRDKEQSGGQVVEMATHMYDLVRYFAGDIESGMATGGQRVVTNAIDFEDTTTAVLTHENGVVSNVSATSTASMGSIELDLVGDGFHLTLDFVENRLSGTVDDEEIDYRGKPTATQIPAMARELDTFLSAVETGDGSLLKSPYSDARRSFELTLAVQESIDTGKTIRMEGL